MTGEKILVISPTWIGDMVMTQALFKLLRANNPDCELDVLCSEHLSALVQRMPEVNNTVHCSFKHGEFNFSGRKQLGKRLQQKGYHHAIVIPNSWKSALVPFFANIPKRTGWRGEWRYGLLNDVRVLDKQRLPLMVQQLLALAQEPAEAPVENYQQWAPRLEVTSQQIQATNTALGLERPTQPVLGLFPGAAFGEAKRWPAEYFAQVALSKLNQGWDVWLFGGPEDQAINDVIQQYTGQRCTSFIGKTTLGQAIDCIAQTSAIVANDTGLMHIAAALDKPQVVVYGSSSPAFTPPLSDQATILRLGLPCSPCFKRTCPLQHFRCMKDLTPSQVLDCL